MFVVTRTFRDRNGVFSAGSIVEPAEIYSFKSRLQQRHIADVSEQDVEQWAVFFLNKFGIDIREKIKEYLGQAPEQVTEPTADEADVTEEASVVEPELEAKQATSAPVLDW